MNSINFNPIFENCFFRIFSCLFFRSTKKKKNLFNFHIKLTLHHLLKQQMMNLGLDLEFHLFEICWMLKIYPIYLVMLQRQWKDQKWTRWSKPIQWSFYSSFPKLIRCLIIFATHWIHFVTFSCKQQMSKLLSIDVLKQLRKLKWIDSNISFFEHFL